MSESKLFAFDFDHTLLNDDSCVYIKKLASPDGRFPDDVESKFSEACWIGYMNAIFSHLHSQGVSADRVRACLEEVPMTPGMPELLRRIREASADNEVIVISDSNLLFIEWLLEYHGLRHLISRVYTNPARVEPDGCLRTEFYHAQDWCELSTLNFCKGRILQDHIKAKRASGTSYSTVFYVGDGFNDYCPTLTLAPTDHVFPRKTFRLAKCLEGNQQVTVSNIWPWDSGHDVVERLAACGIL